MAARFPSGEYTLRIGVYPRVLATQAKNGQEPESWPNEHKRYSARPENLNSGEQIQQGVSQSTGMRKLRIRGAKIPIAAVDRIKIVQSGEWYNVTAVSRDFDTDDTILSAERVPQQSTPQ